MLLRRNSFKSIFLSLSLSLGANSLAEKKEDNFTAPPVRHEALTGNSIVGGTPAAEGEFPFYTGIFSTVAGNSYHLWCGGALIAPRWVITAHHCVKSYDNGNDIPIAKIIISLWRFDTTKNTHQSAMEQAYLYSTASSFVGNDLALIKLKDSINDAKTPPVVLSKTRLSVGQPVSVIGMGRNGENKNPDQLQKADIQVLRDSYCSTDGNVIEPKRELCAGTPVAAPDQDGNEEGTGDGDSGGPLLVKDKGIWKYDAVVSRMALYQQSGKYYNLTIYSEASSDDFKQWIQSTTKENVRYICGFKKLTDEGVSIYQLESCAAAGDWSNVAPYLIAAGQPLKDCYYDPGGKTWDCPAEDTPIHHYQTYFSAPAMQSNGKYESQATVPLIELGN